jgi:hypothetical protein
MRIESLIRRPGGTTVTLNDTDYRFVPSGDDPRHIADVEDPDHIDRLLAIPEGYRLARDGKASKPAAPKPAAPEQDTAPPPAGDKLPSSDVALPDEFDEMTKAQLIEYAEKNNIAVNTGDVKPTIIAEIKKAMGKGATG